MQISHLKALSVDEILAEVADIIARFLPDARILLFGSRARDDAEQTSDFDFAIDAGSKIALDVIARIEDEEKWLRLLEARNLTSHTYDQETAIEVYETVKDNFEVFQGLLEGLRKEIGFNVSL